MARNNGLPTAPDGRREYDVAAFTPAMKARAIRFGSFFCGMFVILVWIPSAMKFYAGAGYREQLKKPEPEKFDLSGPVKPISRTAIPSLVADLQANKSLGHVEAILSKAGDSNKQGMIAWVQGGYDYPQSSHSTSSIVVMGVMGYITLAADGSIEKCHAVGDGVKNLGIEIDAGVWHTAVCLSPRALEFRTQIASDNKIGGGAANSELPEVPPFGSKEGPAWAQKVMDACRGAV